MKKISTNIRKFAAVIGFTAMVALAYVGIPKGIRYAKRYIRQIEREAIAENQKFDNIFAAVERLRAETEKWKGGEMPTFEEIAKSESDIEVIHKALVEGTVTTTSIVQHHRSIHPEMEGAYDWLRSMIEQSDKVASELKIGEQPTVGWVGGFRQGLKVMKAAVTWDMINEVGARLDLFSVSRLTVMLHDLDDIQIVRASFFEDGNAMGTYQWLDELISGNPQDLLRDIPLISDVENMRKAIEKVLKSRQQPARVAKKKVEKKPGNKVTEKTSEPRNPILKQFRLENEKGSDGKSKPKPTPVPRSNSSKPQMARV